MPKRGPDVIVRKRDGYRLLWMPEHPDAHDGRVYEHRHVAEQKIGRPLRRGEVVHHLNGVKQDNRPENIEVLPSQAEHARAHAPTHCRRGHEQVPENLYIRKTNGHRLCKLCVAIDNRERWAKRRARP